MKHSLKPPTGKPSGNAHDRRKHLRKDKPQTVKPK